MDHAEVQPQIGDASALASAGSNAAPVRRDVAPAALAVAPAPGRWARFLDGDVWHSFRGSPTAIAAAAVAALCLFAAVFANVIAPHDPFNLATLELSDSMLPPAWMQGGTTKYLLGTDEQGRDVLSALMFGARISLFVGGASVLLSLVLGVGLGLVSGYVGGRLDALIMRVCDVMLSFPSILIALILIAVLGQGIGKVIAALVTVQWAYYARTVRSAALVERRKEYVEAARCLALSPMRIVFRHLLPNCLPPLIVVATVQVAAAIALEATLSFLGLGLPITEPSLGLLIANGYQYLLSGKYWISFFPGIALLLTIVSINLVADQLRDVLNPRLSR